MVGGTQGYITIIRRNIFLPKFQLSPPSPLQPGASKMGGMQLFLPILRSLAGEVHLSWGLQQE
jgi:hypothetical protein